MGNFAHVCISQCWHFCCVHHLLLFPLLAGSLRLRHNSVRERWQCHCQGFWLCLIWKSGIYWNSLVPSPGSSEFLGSQSWKLSKALRVAAASCQKVPSSRARNGCENAVAMQPWQDVPSAVRLWKYLQVCLPSGPDTVSTGKIKTLILPFLSALTSFLPLMLQKCSTVLQGALLPAMSAVWACCACVHGDLALL